MSRVSNLKKRIEMLSDEKIERLTSAAETIYKFCNKEKGFYSGVVRTASGKEEDWNSYTGARDMLEKQLHRALNDAEVTILALAVGYGPTPYLDRQAREQAFDTLWSRNPEKRRPGCYKKMMDVLISF